jgi:hypothetical protein
MNRSRRRPRQEFERFPSTIRTAKARIHALLRQNPMMSSQQLARTVGCTGAYARIWRRNFFAPGHESDE